MDEIRLIDANALKIELTQQIVYFGDRANTTSIENEKCAYSHCKDGLMLARQMVDNAPTINPERPYVIDSCDMNVFEPEKYMRPEKKLQTPSCLTNPERRDELLERYKEGGNE